MKIELFRVATRVFRVLCTALLRTVLSATHYWARVFNYASRPGARHWRFYRAL